MTDCPCCSGQEFSECCEPIIAGKKKAPTAEALMRSRYSAYATGRLAHLKATLLPKKQDEFDEAAASNWSDDAEWMGLEILSTEDGGADDEKGTVEFVANYELKDKVEAHREIGQFSKVDGSWYYVDGKIVGQEPYKRPHPKIGRNDPCHCGSGKKFKKCCGK